MNKTLIFTAGLAFLATACSHKNSVKPDPTPMPTPLPTAEPASTRSDYRSEEPQTLPARYVVQPGDSLWKIAGQPGVLDDSFLWPALYRQNRDSIVDPDIIEPSQDLAVPRNLKDSERRQAIEDAQDWPAYERHTEPRKWPDTKY